MPAAERAAVFWVCGASGAGKSVAAWALFEALAAEGVRVGYVDIDQLGMLYPASGDDPERHLLKEGALVALLPGYASAGAQVLIVSGVVDPEAGPAALALDGDLTLCLLLVDPAVLRERIRARGCDEKEADEAVAENAALGDATFVDAAIDTARLSVAETVERLRPLVRVVGLPPVSSPSVVRSPAEPAIVVVHGPRAVGSSTVGVGWRWAGGAQICEQASSIHSNSPSSPAQGWRESPLLPSRSPSSPSCTRSWPHEAQGSWW